MNNFLLPRKGFVVTPVVILVNGLIFLILVAMNMSFTQFSPPSLYWLGANYSGWVDAGQWWRFVSSMFLHFGVMHLLFNCVSLLFVGRFLEPLMGSTLFAAVYFLTGISGSLASYLFNSGAVSAGASGAIFGLFGVFIAVLLSNIIQKAQRDEWLKTIGGIVVLNLVMGIVLPIDNAAHLGGLIGGVVLGFLSIPLIKRRIRRLFTSRRY